VTSVRIEPATPGDVESIRSLLVAARLPVAGFEDQFPEAFVLARSLEGDVGCAALEVYGRAALLRSVAVREDVRGRGIGSALVANRLRAARDQGAISVYLLTTTAAAFFQRTGFVPAPRHGAPGELARSPEFAHACPASADCLMLELSP
jgi:amino-acid N-acetyltransferase